MLPETGGTPIPARPAQATTAVAAARSRTRTSSVATAATCTAALGISTQPQPSRSASHPWAGAEAASPTAVTATARPAIAYEPVDWRSSRTVASGTMPLGRRATSEVTATGRTLAGRGGHGRQETSGRA